MRFTKSTKQMIFINFKTYQKATGEQALVLAKMCDQVSQVFGVKIVPVVQAVDIYQLTQAGYSVWAQHVDAVAPGAVSGWLTVEAIKQAGAQGVMINHSDRKLSLGKVEETVTRCQEAGLPTLVLAATVEEGEAIVGSQPAYLGYEPPELIGSRTASVATAKPEVIKEFVKKVGKVPVLVGAGVESIKDVRTSLALGARGVLVASAVVKANDPQHQLEELAKGFKK